MRLGNLLIDVGLPPNQVSHLVRVGDTVSFDTKPLEISGEAISGHTLDNRASVAALTACLEDLQTKTHLWDVWAVATAQEEETLGGAATSAFHLQPGEWTDDSAPDVSGQSSHTKRPAQKTLLTMLKDRDCLVSHCA